MSTFCQVPVDVRIGKIDLIALDKLVLAVETALVFMFALVAIVTIAAVGRPLAEAYAEKLKTRYRAIGSDEAQALQLRIEALENEMREVRLQVGNVQATSEFVAKLIETGESQTVKKLPGK